MFETKVIKFYVCSECWKWNFIFLLKINSFLLKKWKKNEKKWKNEKMKKMKKMKKKVKRLFKGNTFISLYYVKVVIGWIIGLYFPTILMVRIYLFCQLKIKFFPQIHLAPFKTKQTLQFLREIHVLPHLHLNSSNHNQNFIKICSDCLCVLNFNNLIQYSTRF